MAMLIMVVSSCVDGNEEAKNKKSEDTVSVIEQDDKVEKEQSSEDDNRNKEEDNKDEKDSKNSPNEGDEMSKSYPIPKFADNITQGIDFWISKEQLKKKLGEPSFFLEAGDENINEDYNSDFIYYFKEDGSIYEGTSNIKKANVMKKGKELAKKGNIQVVAKFSFNNENEKLELIRMYYVQGGKLFKYDEAHDREPTVVPNKERGVSFIISSSDFLT